MNNFFDDPYNQHEEKKDFKSDMEQLGRNENLNFFETQDGEETADEEGRTLDKKESNILRDDRKEISALNFFEIKGKLLKIKEMLDELIKIVGAEDPIREYENKIQKYGVERKEDDLIGEPQKVIEGVFNGQKMAGKDGFYYDVPANYASKTKLVSGDILKLRILQDGTFRYKQIEKVDRIKTSGVLSYNEEESTYFATANEKKYKVLSASITYYRACPGDEIIIILPRNEESAWAAVDNLKRS